MFHLIRIYLYVTSRGLGSRLLLLIDVSEFNELVRLETWEVKFYSNYGNTQVTLFMYYQHFAE